MKSICSLIHGKYIAQASLGARFQALNCTIPTRFLSGGIDALCYIDYLLYDGYLDEGRITP